MDIPWAIGDHLINNNPEWRTYKAILEITNIQNDKIYYTVLQESEHSKKCDRPTGYDHYFNVDPRSAEYFEHIPMNLEPEPYDTELPKETSWNDLWKGATT